VSTSITPSAQIALPESIERLAEEAVDIIGVRDVIAEKADTLFAQLEACETFSSGSLEADAYFIATSLPIATAVIHHRTPKEQLQHAREWAHEHWPDEQDAGVVLSTLTLVFIIGEGWKRYEKIAAKRALWERIRLHLASLAEEPSAATTAA
jgi:hypothetical protein